MTLRVRQIVVAILCMCGGYDSVWAWCRRDSTFPVGSSQSILRELRSSDFVFAGTVVELGDGHITFNASNVWKGQMSSRITFVYDDRVVDSLAIYFLKGQGYVVFGGASLEGFSASSCGNTERAEKAASLINELDRIRKDSLLVDSFLGH